MTQALGRERFRNSSIERWTDMSVYKRVESISTSESTRTCKTCGFKNSGRLVFKRCPEMGFLVFWQHIQCKRFERMHFNDAFVERLENILGLKIELCVFLPRLCYLHCENVLEDKSPTAFANLKEFAFSKLHQIKHLAVSV